MAIVKRILAVSILTVSILTGVSMVESDLQQETKQAPASRPTLIKPPVALAARPAQVVNLAAPSKEAVLSVSELRAEQLNIKPKAVPEPVAKPVTLNKSRVKTVAKQPKAVTTTSAGSTVTADSYGEWMTFTATYYNAGLASTGKSPGDDDYGVTYSGRTVEDGITVAVDDAIFPVVKEGKGTPTWIEVKYPDGRIEKRRVDDTGSAIHGRKIDIYVNKSNSVLRGPGYGKHKVQVRVIKPVAS